MDNLNVSYHESPVEEVMKVNITNNIQNIMGKYQNHFQEILNEIMESAKNPDLTAKDLIERLSNTMDVNLDKYLSLEGVQEIATELKMYLSKCEDVFSEMEKLPTKDHELSVDEAVRQVSILTSELGTNEIALVPEHVIANIMMENDIDNEIDSGVIISLKPTIDEPNPQPVTYGEKVKMDLEEERKQQESLPDYEEQKRREFEEEIARQNSVKMTM